MWPMAIKKEKYLYRKDGIWWVKIPMGAGAKPHYESTGIREDPKSPTRVPAGAILKRNELVSARDQKTAMRSKGVRAGKQILIGELLDDYIEYLRGRSKAYAPIAAQVIDKEHGIRSVFGSRVASSLENSDILKYRRQFDGDSHKQATANRHLALLRAAMNHAWKRQKPEKIRRSDLPYFEMTDEQCNARKGFIEAEGYRAILAELTASIRPFFICAYHVGTRKGELLKITWDAVDLDEGLITIDASIAKNNTSRYLPINGDMEKALREQKQLRDREFPHTTSVFFWHREDVKIGHGGSRSAPGAPVRDFRASWNSAVERAGYPGLLVHDMRRSATRNMRKAGIDQSMRMKINGHKTPSMEIRYNIADVGDVKDAGKRMAKWAAEQRA